MPFAYDELEEKFVVCGIRARQPQPTKSNLAAPQASVEHIPAGPGGAQGLAQHARGTYNDRTDADPNANRVMEARDSGSLRRENFHDPGCLTLSHTLALRTQMEPDSILQRLRVSARECPGSEAAQRRLWQMYCDLFGPVSATMDSQVRAGAPLVGVKQAFPVAKLAVGTETNGGLYDYFVRRIVPQKDESVAPRPFTGPDSLAAPRTPLKQLASVSAISTARTPVCEGLKRKGEVMISRQRAGKRATTIIELPDLP